MRNNKNKVVVFVLAITMMTSILFPGVSVAGEPGNGSSIQLNQAEDQQENNVVDQNDDSNNTGGSSTTSTKEEDSKAKESNKSKTTQDKNDTKKKKEKIETQSTDVLTKDEAEELIDNFKFSNLYDNKFLAGKEESVSFFMSNRILGGEDSGKNFENVEVRLYFSNGYDFIDTDMYSNGNKTQFSYGGFDSNFTLNTDDPNKPYLSFVIPKIEKASNGIFEIPIKFKNGLTPDGTQLIMDAELLYKGEEDSYSVIDEAKNFDMIAVSEIEWNTTPNSSPSTTMEIPQAPGEFAPESGGMYFNVDVKNAKNGATTGVQYASSFKVSNTINVPTGIAINENDIRISIENKDINSSSEGISGYNIKKNADGTISVEFTYTPDVAGEVSDFSYKIHVDKITTDTNFNSGESKSVTMNGSVQVSGKNSATDWSNIGLSTDSTLTFKKPELPPNYNPIVGDSLKIVKELVDQTSGGAVHGETVSFKISEINFNSSSTAVAITVTDFAIEDYDFHKYLIPEKITTGKYEDERGSRLPQKLIITVATGSSFEQIEKTISTENETIDLKSLVEGHGYSLTDITKMALYFGDVTSDFKLVEAPVFDFKVNVEEPFDGGTAGNWAGMSFGHKKDAESDVYKYEKSASSSVQLKENDMPKVNLNKTFKNLTSGGSNVAPNEELEYTISLKNDSKVGSNRIIKNPTINDAMPTGYLDFNSFEVTSITLKGNTVSGSGFSLKDPSNQKYTSKSTTNNGTKNEITKVVWEFISDTAIYPGQELVITYKTKVKTKEQLEDLGAITSGSSLKINNNVWYNEHNSGTSTNMPDPTARPYIDFSMTSSTERFDTEDTTPVAYTVNVSNKFNKYEGSKNVDKFVLTGKLPKGFTFPSDEAGIKDTFQVTAPSSWTVNAPSVTSSAGAYTLNYGSFTIVVKDDSFILSTEYKETLDPDDPSTSGGILRCGDENTSGESFSLVFKGNVPKDATGFVKGYEDTFTAESQLFVWDSIKEGSNVVANSLNTDAKTGGFRFDTPKGGMVGYTADTNNVDGNNKTTGMLQAKKPIIGNLMAPKISLGKSRDKTNYRIGDTVEYTLTLKNHALTPITAGAFVDKSLLDLLPTGQSITSGGLKATGKEGSDELDITKSSVNGRDVYKISLPDDFNLKGAELISGSSKSLVAGEYKITFYAVVNDDSMDALEEYKYEMSQTNYAGLVVSEDDLDKVYQNLSGDKVGKIDKDPSNRWIDGTTNDRALEAYASTKYLRDRVFPTISKSILDEPNIKRNGTSIEWKIKVGNSNQGNTTLKKPYIVDILPYTLEYTPGSSYLGNIGIGDPTIINNVQHNGISGTALVWELSKNIDLNQTYDLKYKTKAVIKSDTDYNEWSNTAYVLPQDNQQDIFFKQPSVYTAGNSMEFLNDLSNEASNNKLDDYSQKKAVKTQSSVGIWGDFNMDHYKEIEYGGQTVKSEGNKLSSLAINKGEEFNYNLNIKNDTKAKDIYNYKDMVIIDRLPYLNDINVNGSGNRSSEFTPTLLEGIEISVDDRVLDPSEYTLHYMTKNTALTDQDWTTSTSISGWTDTYTTGSQIYGFKVYIKGDQNGQVLKGNDSVKVTVPMKMPETYNFPVKDSNEYTAWNSFGFKMSIDRYKSENLNNSVSLNPIESLKVGAKLYDDRNASIAIKKEERDLNNQDVTKASNKKFNVTVNGPDNYSENIQLNSTNDYTVTLAGLALGKYVITETTDENGTDVNDLYNVHVENSSGSALANNTVVINELPEGDKTVKLINQRKPGTINVGKTFEDGTTPDGIKFVLKDSSSNTVGDDVTDGNGNVEFNSLEWGTYTLFEHSPMGYVPSGFVKSNDQTGAAADTVIYEKKITVPNRSGLNNYTVDSSVNVNNVTGTSIFSVAKQWNGKSEEPSNNTQFVLMPSGTFDMNNAISLTKNGNNYNSPELASGEYDLYEVTNKKFTPTGFTKVTDSYSSDGGHTVFSLFKYNKVIILNGIDNISLTVNNTYYVPPVKPTIPDKPDIPNKPELPDRPDRPDTPGGTLTPSGGGGGTTGGTPASGTGTPAARDLTAPGADPIQTENIEGNQTPAAAPIVGNWSLLNLIMSIIALIISIALAVNIIVNRKKKHDDEEDEQREYQYLDNEYEDEEQEKYKKRSNLLKFLAIIPGLLTGILFIILEDMTLPMVFINHWTPLIGLVFIIHAIIVIAQLILKKKKDDEDEEEEQGATVA